MPGEFRKLTIEGPAGPLAVWTSGEAANRRLPILFIHPINLQGACWKDLALRLQSGRLRVMPDLRGHGSSSPSGPYGVREWAADCMAVMDHLKLPLFHIVGGSLGGPIATFLAAEHRDRIASITSIGGALVIRGANVDEVLRVLRSKGVQGMFRQEIPKISLAPGTSSEIIENVLALCNPNDVDTVYEIWKAVMSADVSQQASQVRCPALVINGEADLTCTVAQGAEMASKLRTHLVVLPGLGHLPMLEAPASLVSLLDQHLARSESK